MKVSPDVMEVLKLLLKLSDLDDLGIDPVELVEDARQEINEIVSLLAV